MEPVSITAIVVSIITAIGVLLSRLRMKHCLCGCIESDCINTPEPSPEPSPPPSVYITDHTPQSSPNLHRRNMSEV
jgi:hypothetical protein